MCSIFFELDAGIDSGGSGGVRTKSFKTKVEKDQTTNVCIVQIPLNPHFSLARNLACVLLTINALIGLKNVPELLFTWTVVEDDRALYLFRDVTGKRIHQRKGETLERWKAMTPVGKNAHPLALQTLLEGCALELFMPTLYAILLKGDTSKSWGRMDYARALIDIRADWELKEDMVIAIPNVKDDREDDMLCPKGPVKKPKKQHTNHDGFQHPSSSHGTNLGSKNYEVCRKVTSSTNPFDALNTIKEGDELGSNRGLSNSGKKVVQDVAGLTCGSPSNTPLVARINELESQMIEGKLVLLDEDGKPLKPSKSTLPSSSNEVSTKVDDLVNEDNDSEVEEVYDETATYMAFTSFNVNKASKSGSGGGNKNLYEQ
ncbi:hypothetical protein Tco_0968536 [Tanacetum coccineum]